MPILNYTTSIAVEKSMAEIISILTRRGVTRISTVFDSDGAPAGIAFVMKTDYGIREFELPVKVAGVLQAMEKDPKIPRSQCNSQQAARVAWRIAKDWLEAQAALIDAELASLDQVMLPYMVNGEGRTVYAVMRESAMRELES